MNKKLSNNKVTTQPIDVTKRESNIIKFTKHIVVRNSVEGVI
jgi:hypothetical protein